MYSEDVWEEVLPKLQSFYFDAILLELASLYYQQCSIFEPSDRVQSPDIWHVSKLCSTCISPATMWICVSVV